MNALRPISRLACLAGLLGAVGCAGNVAGNGGGPDEGTGGATTGTRRRSDHRCRRRGVTGAGGAGTQAAQIPVRAVR